MRRILATTALALVTGTAAIAQDADMLRTQVENYFGTSPMQVDVSTLTDEQVVKVSQALSASDDAEARMQSVRAVLAEDNVMVTERDMELMVPTPRDQVYTAVQSYLETSEYDVSAAELSDDELIQIFTVIGNTEDRSDVNDSVRGILMN